MCPQARFLRFAGGRAVCDLRRLELSCKLRKQREALGACAHRPGSSVSLWRAQIDFIVSMTTDAIKFLENRYCLPLCYGVGSRGR